jgi:non-heme chloroperoxidase
LEKELDQLKSLPREDQELAPIIRKLQTVLPQFEKDLSATQAALQTDPHETSTTPLPPETLEMKIDDAITSGAQKYTEIEVPALAMFEDPPLLPANAPPDVRAAQDAEFDAQSKAFEIGVPSARVVRLPNGRHALWMTNEADVLAEMNAFMAGLK